MKCQECRLRSRFDYICADVSEEKLPIASISSTRGSRVEAQRGKLSPRMGKADTPLVKHPLGGSLSLRQAGVALARAEADDDSLPVTNSSPRSGPPGPSPRVRGQEAGAHNSGTREAVSPGSSSWFADINSPSSDPSDTAPQGSPPAQNSRNAAAGATLGRESVPQSVRMGLPDFDVFEADIFDSEDDFEEAEDTVADVLTPGVVRRGTASKQAAVPHAALERPTAERGLPRAELAPVPRVSLLTETGTLEPAVTLGPNDSRIEAGTAIARPSTVDEAISLRSGVLAQIAYDIQSSKREIAICFAVGSVLALFAFFAGRSYLENQGWVAHEGTAPAAKTVLPRRPQAQNLQPIIPQGVGAEDGIPSRSKNSGEPAETPHLSQPRVVDSEKKSEKSVGNAPDNAPDNELGKANARKSRAVSPKANKRARKSKRARKRAAGSLKRSSKTQSQVRSTASGSSSVRKNGRKKEARQSDTKRRKGVKRRSGRRPSRAQSAGLEEAMPF